MLALRLGRFSFDVLFRVDERALPLPLTPASSRAAEVSFGTCKSVVLGRALSGLVEVGIEDVDA
jgi:hypothetical protein